MRDFAPVFSYRAEICRSTVRLDRNRQSAISWALLSEEIIWENTSHSRSVSPYFAMNASLRSSSDFWEAGGSLGSMTAFMRAVYTAIATLTATNSTRAMTMAARLLPVASSATDPLVIRAALTLFMARPMPAHSDGRRICRESSIKLAVKKTTKKPEDR